MTAYRNYQGCIIYSEDLNCLEDGNWLNDTCIHMSMFRLQSEYPQSSLLFMDPTVISYFNLQLDTSEQILFIKDLDLLMKSYVFIPISDRISLTSPSTHWSLLVLHVPSLSFLHFDSIANKNKEAANITMKNLCSAFEYSNIPYEVPQAKTPQQSNSYDCGVYTVLMAETLAVELIGANADLPSLKEHLEKTLSTLLGDSGSSIRSHRRMLRSFAESLPTR